MKRGPFPGDVSSLFQLAPAFLRHYSTTGCLNHDCLQARPTSISEPDYKACEYNTKMPLFNRSQDEQQQPDNEQQQQQQVDERTRLLPPGSSSGGPGTLTPDDPAVTPYNLWTIRVLRLATVALGLVTAVWFALVLVSAFATPPGLETRGGPFTALGFASLALANVGFALVFFGAPARAVRILRMIRGVRPVPWLPFHRHPDKPCVLTG